MFSSELSFVRINKFIQKTNQNMNTLKPLIFFSLVLILSTFFFVSCGPDDPEAKEPLLITRTSEVFLNSVKLQSDLLNSSEENFEYGFVYSEEVDVPALGVANVKNVAATSTVSLKYFDHSVIDLKWGTAYAFRPYISFGGRVIYGNVGKFNTSIKPNLQLISPRYSAAHEVSKFKQTFTWNDRSGLSEAVYTVYAGTAKEQLNLQSLPDGGKIEQETFETENLNLGGSASVAYNGKYYWRVEACHRGNICIKSDIDSFQVYKKISNVKYQVITNAVDFTWQSPSNTGSNSMRYSLNFSTEDLTNDTKGKVEVVARVSATEKLLLNSTLEAHGFQKGVTFYYQVRAYYHELLVSQSDWTEIKY